VSLPTPVDQVLAMASGAWATQMIHVAAELALADHLAPGELDVEELAQVCGANPDALFRLLRGLASLGLFCETSPRRFALTPLAELLRSDHPLQRAHRRQSLPPSLRPVDLCVVSAAPGAWGGF